jgi:alpha-L-arabinofuranosidase
MKSIARLIIPALLGFVAIGTHQIAMADTGSLRVDVSARGPKIGPLFYGLMTEEINHAYDGGLYAELIQNRIFQDKKEPVCWSAVGDGAITIDTSNPVNDIALERSLRLDSTGNHAGISNTGFWGIPVWPNTTYHASFYARADANGPLAVEIQSNDGKTTFARATIPAITTGWNKYEANLTTADVQSSSTNRFVITTASKGSIWFSLVSLFPPTYHNRPNGNRIDISEKLAALHPAFLRFPGGNFLEGDTIPTRFDWKNTIGPLENRPGHMGCWGYHVSDGLGLLEFLRWCEDLKMEPLLAVYAGYSLKGDHVNPGADLEPYVQDALDEIEYCTGDTNTTWGKHRAEDGHSQPFVIHYIEIGNEDWFDNSGAYDGRFTQIFRAIKAKYPNLLCIASARSVHSVTPDLYDDHGYPHPQDMLRMVNRYDHYSPDQPKVFFGEWATQDGKPTPTMRAALCDAAWLTGLQRDCDTVQMNCYAPLLVNVNPGAWQWPTNLIGYNATSSFGSPSYYAQAMYSRAWGDTVLPVTLTAQKVQLPPEPLPHGAIGLGTWHTAAEYKDLTVKQEDTALFASDFNIGVKDWTFPGGKWEAGDGVLRQTDASKDFHATFGDRKWSDYTIDVKARKTAGNEGFLILFHVKDRSHYGWINLGGWNNTRSAIQIADGGEPEVVGDTNPFTVEPGKWYDIRIELTGLKIKCFVDDKLILQALQTPAQPMESLFATASKVDSTGEVILKVVNTSAADQQIEIDLQNAGSISSEATVEVLQGDPEAQNTVDAPANISPKQESIDDAGIKFVHAFPANSISVIRLKSQATPQPRH